MLIGLNLALTLALLPLSLASFSEAAEFVQAAKIAAVDAAKPLLA